MIKEKVTPFKVAATTLCVAGAIMVSLAKREDDGGGHGGNWSNLSLGTDDVGGIGGNWSIAGGLLRGGYRGKGGASNCPNSTSVSASAARAGHGVEAAEAQAPSSEGYGYVMCLLSTTLYAVFEVAYKRFACDEKDDFPLANSQRFLGLIGLSCLAFTWVFPILDVTGIENFTWYVMEAHVRPPHLLFCFSSAVAWGGGQVLWGSIRMLCIVSPPTPLPVFTSRPYSHSHPPSLFGTRRNDHTARVLRSDIATWRRVCGHAGQTKSRARRFC
jgi:drug/metabolite transporter (DMT)-like permease